MKGLCWIRPIILRNGEAETRTLPFYQFYQEIQANFRPNFLMICSNKGHYRIFYTIHAITVLRDHLDEFADFFVSIWPH